MVPLSDSFFFLAFIWPPKAKGCATAVSAYDQKNMVFKKLHVSFSFIVPGIRHTYKLYVSFSYIVPGHILSYIFAEQWNAATRWWRIVLASISGVRSWRGTPFCWIFLSREHSGATLVSIRGVHTFSLAPCCWDGDERATKWYHNVWSEIEDFVETNLCKLRGILRSRVLQYGFHVTSSRMLVLIEGDKIWQLWNSVSV